MNSRRSWQTEVKRTCDIQSFFTCIWKCEWNISLIKFTWNKQPSVRLTSVCRDQTFHHADSVTFNFHPKALTSSVISERKWDRMLKMKKWLLHQSQLPYLTAPLSYSLYSALAVLLCFNQFWCLIESCVWSRSWLTQMISCHFIESEGAGGPCKSFNVVRPIRPLPVLVFMLINLEATNTAVVLEPKMNNVLQIIQKIINEFI